MSSLSTTCHLTGLDGAPVKQPTAPTKPLVETAELLSIYRALEAGLRSADYKGWDPFDGLNSRLFIGLGMNRSRFLRLAWIQFFKRSPINFRRLAAVPRSENPKAIALMSMAYARMDDHDRQEKLVRRLLDSQLPGGGWGYPFDWQARAFFVPIGTPNVICTAYAVQALVEHQRKCAADHTAAIDSAAKFVATQLLRRTDGSTYIAYIPSTQALVHNASLWGAYVLAVASNAGRASDAYSSLVKEIVRCTVDAQRDDGSWAYGNLPHHQFVDSFHTGFNLQALSLIKDLAPDLSLDHAISAGLEYYTTNFFEDDGRPKYYDRSAWPIDCHCTAQACLTLLTDKLTTQQRQIGLRVLSWTVQNMWSQRRGIFFYQRHRFYTNRIDYMRWTQAWMMLTIGHALQSLSTPLDLDRIADANA